MVKSEREETLAALSARIFSSLLEDIVLDVAFQSHHEIARGRAVCKICNTRCNSVHTPASASASAPATGAPSRAGTPATDGKVPAGTPSGSGSKTAHGNVYFDCTNCGQQIASNRYAPHLSGCMGLANGTRRGAARGGAKSKTASDAARSASPRSDGGVVEEEPRAVKGKGKSKSKRADEAEFNLKRKRPASPQLSPNKKQKKQRKNGSPVTRVKSDADTSSIASNAQPLQPNGSHKKIPSRLREASTASFIERSVTPSSRYSSPGVASVATPTSSFSAHSPSLASNSKTKKAKVNGVALPPKRPSPPRPPPPLIPDYTVDVEGEETGSSTDTDSG